MPPSVRVILNYDVGGYDVTGAGRAYEGQEGVQHFVDVSISSLYDVSTFSHIRSTV